MFARRFAAPVIALLCPIASAQYIAGKIVFKNPGTYVQADLEAVAGLHPHEKVSSEVVQAAAQRLIDTGYFDDVGATLEGPAAAINVTFALKPLAPAQMTAVGFENFVWFTPGELTGILHKASPLFSGRLPEAGNQTDAITLALKEALAAKEVNATVAHATIEPSLEQPYRAIVFSVSHPAVRIHALKLQGVSSDLAPQVQKLALKLRNTPYNEGLAKPTTADSLLVPYLDAGYIDAALENTQRIIAEMTGDAVGVDISAAVHQGELYHVGSFVFAGAPLISSEAVLSTAKLHAGDVASRALLLQTLAPIDAAYRRQGYMDVFVDPGAKPDAATHTVSYTVTVTPGQQYRLRTVTANGLSPAAQADFDRGWRMTAGALYDPGYITGFMKNNTALRALQNFTCVYRASADPQTHLVDLTLTCFPSTGK